MGAIVVVFWFLLIRPQQKKDKAVKKMRAELKVGDRVCTIGGLYGTVQNIKDDVITIGIGPGKDKQQVVIARWAIGSTEGTDAVDDSLN